MNGNEIAAAIREEIDTPKGKMRVYNVGKLEKLGIVEISRFPYSLRVLVESLARNQDGYKFTGEHLDTLLGWQPGNDPTREIPFMPARVILQDFTGVPAVVDLAALRSAMERAGKPPGNINPQVPVDLVIDHSVQVDYFGRKDSLERNMEKEFERNGERYRLLKWAQQAFDNFRVVPPGRGIIHQVNLEYLGSVVHVDESGDVPVAHPDSVLGTDSHTPMINSLGVLGWGVGGIEAEATMLGQPYYMLVPKVVGVRLIGQVKPGITATDVVLTVVQKLRRHGVVGKFVEFTGPGLTYLSLADRATLANMAPEYGATIGFFPVDVKTLEYLRASGRRDEHVAFVEQYLRHVGLFREEGEEEPGYDETVEIDLSTVEPCLAGPNQPKDRIPLGMMKERFEKDFESWLSMGDGKKLHHGDVVIAAITSCTNTSNPSVLVGAALMARNALERGLSVKPHVKTSLAPGSRVVTAYLERAGLLDYLEKLGFHVVAYGCTTCIGNSGPLVEGVAESIDNEKIVAASVISGNRNFEGRVHSHVRASYLASPPLVIAFAIAGTVRIDLDKDPVGTGSDGRPVFLRDIWPSNHEIDQIISKNVTPDIYREQYKDIFKGNDLWENLEPPTGPIYRWDDASTYIREPPFFVDFPAEAPGTADIVGGRILALLGDAITTDHISPAGAIPPGSPAAKYLESLGVDRKDFNSFGSRRGNHEVMMRGTFGNIRIRNKLVDREGGYTLHVPSGEEMPIYDAAMRYREEGTPLVIIAGEQYGTGSSRDWAAKGTILLGVKAVIAKSYERIHRSNLVGMGVLPLEFLEGEDAETHGITGREIINVVGLERLEPGAIVTIILKSDDGTERRFQARTRLDSQVEIDYYRNGGILHAVLRQKLKE